MTSGWERDLVTYCCTCRRCNSPRWCPSPGKVVHRGWVAARHRIFSWCACSLCRTPTMPTIWTILRPPLLRSPGKEKRGERFEGSSFFRWVVKGTWGGGGAGGIDVKATVKSHVETGQSSRNSSPIPTSLVRNPYSSIRTRDSSSLRPRLIDSYGRIRGKKKRIPVVYAFNLVVDSSRDTILTNGSFHFRYIF